MSSGAPFSKTPGEAMPRLGEHVVLIDGKGSPRCVWQTTDVAVKPLNQVDEKFAWDEGEGDRTLASWLEGHRRYFAMEAARDKFDFRDDIETVPSRVAARDSGLDFRALSTGRALTVVDRWVCTWLNL